MGEPNLSTFAIDEATGDVEFPLRKVTGAAAFRLRLMARFEFFKGEWFLDTRVGMPYYQQILGRNPDLGLIRSIFRIAVESTPGAQAVTEFETVLHRDTRELEISKLTVKLTDGAVFRAQSGKFIINLDSV